MVDAFLAKNSVHVNRNGLSNETILQEISLHNTRIYHETTIRDANLLDAYDHVLWPKDQRSLLTP